jgi:hypothetical protein
MEDLPNLISLLVFFGTTAFLFRSWRFALIVTASLGFHELGHAALLAYFRLNWRISFGLVGAWTWSPMDERARLSQFANAAIHLAGPFFSLLLALIALGLHAWLRPESQHLLLLANFSATVGFLNLLPLGPLSDGGKVMRRLVDSLHGPARAWAVLLPMLVSALALLLYAMGVLLRLSSQASSAFILALLLVGLWMGSSLLIEARRRPASAPLSTTAAPLPAKAAPLTKAAVIPDAAASIPVTGKTAAAPAAPAGMTSMQGSLVLVTIWDLLVLGLMLINATPFWLAPEFLLGSLRNVVDVLRLLAQALI